MTELAELADRVLRDLELPALRAKHRDLGEMAEMPSSSGNFYFYTDPYEFGNHGALEAKAEALNKLPNVAMRCAELAADGIWPRVLAGSEAGHEELAIFVEFDERGRKLLRGNGGGWSTGIRSARKSLRFSYWFVAIPLVAAIVIERLYKHGWMTTFAALGLVSAVVALTVWFRKRS